jgi:hypothetical protein
MFWCANYGSDMFRLQFLTIFSELVVCFDTSSTHRKNPAPWRWSRTKAETCREQWLTINHFVQQVGVNHCLISGSACTGDGCHDARTLPLGRHPYVFVPSVRFFNLFYSVFNPCFTCRYSTGYLQGSSLYKFLCIFICTIVFLLLLFLLLPVRFILRQEWLRLVTYRLFLNPTLENIDSFSQTPRPEMSCQWAFSHVTCRRTNTLRKTLIPTFIHFLLASS